MSYFKDWLPKEIKLNIIEYIRPNKIILSELDICIKSIQAIIDYDDTLNNIKHFNDLLRVRELYQKYSYYNKRYEIPLNYWYRIYEDLVIEPTQLLDALFAGCKLPYASSSVKYYDDTVEQDIKDIIRLIPNSIYCNLGSLRCRYYVTPLAAACHNDNIPSHIIKLLFEAGCSSLTQIKLNTSVILLRDDIHGNIEEPRLSQILLLFEQYK